MFEVRNDCVLKATNEKELVQGLLDMSDNKQFYNKTFPNRCEINIQRESNSFLEIKCCCGIRNIWKKRKNITSYACKCGKVLIKLMDKNKFDFIANRSTT